jgi:hypothetical protein
MGDPYIRKAYFHGITCPGIVLVERVNNAWHLHKMANRCDEPLRRAAGPLARSRVPGCQHLSLSSPPLPRWLIRLLINPASRGRTRDRHYCVAGTAHFLHASTVATARVTLLSRRNDLLRTASRRTPRLKIQSDSPRPTCCAARLCDPQTHTMHGTESFPSIWDPSPVDFLRRSRQPAPNSHPARVHSNAALRLYYSKRANDAQQQCQF